jgi:signal transduction histidine kinase/ligand-binding sensor domain-containing protein
MMHAVSSVDRRRRIVAVQTVLVCGLLTWCPRAFALDPALDISQYAHTAWRVREGFSKGSIGVIAQTADGYLWLGTEFGLLRFDGVRALPWQPPAGETLPSTWIRALLAGRDGTLWIGTLKGLASLNDGKLTHYPATAGSSIDALLEDRHGTIWAAGFEVPHATLCTIESRTRAVDCHVKDGTLGAYVGALCEDSDGNLWVGATTGLWRWKPGPPRVYGRFEAMNLATAVTEGDNHALIIASLTGIKTLVNGRFVEFPVPAQRRFTPFRMLRDRHGGFWIGTSSGLVHVHQGRTDVFAQSDGLSADFVNGIFEDREGSIWIATVDGLDRFREVPVVTLSVKQGLPNNAVGSVLATSDGAVWLGDRDGLTRWKDGQIDIDPGYRGVKSLFQNERGRIVVSTRAGVGSLDGGRVVPITGVPAGNIRGIAEDRAGDLWLAHQEVGLVHVHRDSRVESIPWSKLGRSDFATVLSADPARGGVWLGFYQGGVAHFAGGTIRARYTAADGLTDGIVNHLVIDSDGTLWAATEGGLSRLKDERLTTLSSRNGLPCDTMHWLIEDATRSMWLYTACGLLRIEQSEVSAWVSDPKKSIRSTVFDSSDGVRLHSFAATTFKPQVTRSSEGKLWFVSGEGVSVVDPGHIPFNNLPPPVHVEQIIADHKTYDVPAATNASVGLPSLIRDLQIDYTALSTVAPERVRFRYKLEGWDREWQDVGTRRQAFYTNLPPRRYRFRVMACNNSGVWNEAGTSVDFDVAPAYYQTRWFRVMLFAGGVALLGAVYQLRVRQVRHQVNLRMEERVSERTRIARDLHDTLLQSFHGVVFRFQAAANVLPDRPSEAKQQLDAALKEATHAIREGRDAVQGLRASTTDANDLAVALSSFGEQLAATRMTDTHAETPGLDVAIHGTPRTLRPIVRDDVYRIASEALRNAFRHARARRIELEIRYDDRQFALRIRDDGQGIDAAVLDGDRAGHFGLPGMRERAELIGGRFEVWSESGMGTEVALTIPAAAVYAIPRTRRHVWSFLRRRRTES